MANTLYGFVEILLLITLTAVWLIASFLLHRIQCASLPPPLAWQTWSNGDLSYEVLELLPGDRLLVNRGVRDHRVTEVITTAQWAQLVRLYQLEPDNLAPFTAPRR